MGTPTDTPGQPGNDLAGDEHTADDHTGEDHTSEDHTGDAPYLPPSLPTIKPIPLSVPVPTTPSESGPTQAGDAPMLPSTPRAAPAAEPEPVVFDAKALVESQKRVVQHPAYGAIPKATPESVAALEALRAKARRKRRRNRIIGWVIALLMLGGIATAGWYAYQAYQDDQDQLDADRAAAQADGTSAAPGALTPLGNQQDVIDALDDVNSGPTAGAGGLLSAVQDAQAAIDEANRPPSTPSPPTAPALTLLDVRPEAVVRLGTGLDDLERYERHIVDRRQFVSDSPDGYARFVALMQAQPQLDPQAPAFEVLPSVGPGQIGVAVVRDGDRVIRAIVVSGDPAIHVDYAP